jgi:hypothetical protein
MTAKGTVGSTTCLLFRFMFDPISDPPRHPSLHCPRLRRQTRRPPPPAPLRHGPHLVAASALQAPGTEFTNVKQLFRQRFNACVNK